MVVSVERKVELLAEQIAAANNWHPDNFQQWHDKTEVILRTVMSADHPVMKKFRGVH